MVLHFVARSLTKCNKDGVDKKEDKTINYLINYTNTIY